MSILFHWNNKIEAELTDVFTSASFAKELTINEKQRRYVAIMRANLPTDQMTEMVDGLVEACKSSPWFGAQNPKAFKTKPSPSTVLRLLHSDILLGFMFGYFYSDAIVRAISSPKTDAAKRHHTTVNKSKNEFVFGWPNSFSYADAKSIHQRLVTVAKAGGTQTTTGDVPGNPSLATKALVYGTVLLKLNDKEECNKRFANAYGSKTLASAEALLRLSKELRGKVQEMNKAGQWPDDIRHGFTDVLAAKGENDDENKSDADLGDFVIVDLEKLLNPSYVPAIDSLVTQASDKRFGTLVELMSTWAEPRIKYETDKLNSQINALMSAEETMKSEIDRLKSAVASRPSTMPMVGTGPVAGLAWSIEMQSIADVLKLADPSIIAKRATVPVFTWTDADENIVTHGMVPEALSHYVWRDEVVEALALAVHYNAPGWLTGDTGTGKSTAVMQLAALCNWPLIRVNLDSDMSRMDLIGRDVLKDGMSQFIDGPLPRALNMPSLLLLDEIDFARPELLYVIQRVLEGQGLAIPEDGMREIMPHAWCRIVATSNTKGQGDERRAYAGARVLSLALIDRFGAWGEVDYMNVEEERNLLVEMFPTIDITWIKLLVQVATSVREAFRRDEIVTTVSPRALIACCNRMLLSGDDHANTLYAMRALLAERAGTDDRQKILDIINRH